MSLKKQNPIELKRKVIRDLAINQRGIAFDPNSGECFSLNQTAFQIVKSLQDGFSIQSVIEEFKDRWCLEDPSTIEKSVFRFVDELKRHKLYV